MQQQLPRPLQSELEVIAGWDNIEVLLEEPFELPPRQTDVVRQFAERHRLFDVGFHQRYRFGELRLGRSDAVLQRHALPVFVLAHALANEQLRHFICKLGPLPISDIIQYQVEGCRATGTGLTVAVDFKDLG